MSLGGCQACVSDDRWDPRFPKEPGGVPFVDCTSQVRTDSQFGTVGSAGEGIALQYGISSTEYGVGPSSRWFVHNQPVMHYYRL